MRCVCELASGFGAARRRRPPRLAFCSDPAGGGLVVGPVHLAAQVVGLFVDEY